MSCTSSLLLVAGSMIGQADEAVLHKAPAIEVRRQPDYGQPAQEPPLVETYLHYHKIYWGKCYDRPKDREAWGHPDKDFSRLPTTYYHPSGPLGYAFRKLDPFPGAPNTFHGDARIVTSLFGLGGQWHSQLLTQWSEPPIAVLGLNVGTEAAYARPYQTMDFFERNPDLIALSAPPKGKTRYFAFIADAQDRGAAVHVHQGEHRSLLEKKAADSFYRLIVIESVKEGKDERLHEDLLTKEAMQMLMSKTAEDGVLCFHTSHRYINLPPLIASVAEDCGYSALVGKVNYDRLKHAERGLFSSEWVMVVRRPKYLEHLKAAQTVQPIRLWFEPAEFTDPRLAWKDGQRNTLAGLWRSSPVVTELRKLVYNIRNPLANTIGFRNAEVVIRTVMQQLEGIDRIVTAFANQGFERKQTAPP